MGDPQGTLSYEILFILPHESQSLVVSDSLRYYAGIPTDVNDFWARHYPPHVKALMDKISWHKSGFPWMTEEQQTPDDPGRYNASAELLRRTVMLHLGYYLTRP